MGRHVVNMLMLRTNPQELHLLEIGSGWASSYAELHSGMRIALHTVPFCRLMMRGF